MLKFYALILLTLLSGNALVAVAQGSDFNNLPRFATSNRDAKCEQPREDYINVEYIRVRYVEAGAGPVLVMIHGNAGSVEDFDFKSLGLLCHDHRVIAVDRPGHGKSDRPNDSTATLQYQTRLLHETLSHLGISRPTLVGHSWGGALALAYAVDYPNELSAIVLLAPAAYADAGEDQFLRLVLKTPIVGDVSLTVGRLLFGKRILKKELARAFYPNSVPEDYLHHACSLWLRRKQLRAYFEDEWSLNKDLERMSKHYSEIRIPVIVVTGDHDKVVSAKNNAYRLKTSITQSQLIVLKNTGHQLPQTHPESIYNALTLIPKSSAQLRASVQ